MTAANEGSSDEIKAQESDISRRKNAAEAAWKLRTAINADLQEAATLLLEIEPHIAALNDAEHMLDGFTIGPDGMPVGKRSAQRSDLLLERVRAFLSRHRATSAAPQPGREEGR